MRPPPDCAGNRWARNRPGEEKQKQKKKRTDREFWSVPCNAKASQFTRRRGDGRWVGSRVYLTARGWRGNKDAIRKASGSERIWLKAEVYNVMGRENNQGRGTDENQGK